MLRSRTGTGGTALIALLLAVPLAGQARSSGERASAPIRISGGKIRIGTQPAGSIRSFSDRGALARVIRGRLERVGDPRANRFGPGVDERRRAGRRGRPLRGGYYDPYGFYRDSGYRGRVQTVSAHDPRYVPPTPATRGPRIPGRAYDLQGPPSYTPIRVHGDRLVRAGFRLRPLLLPTLVVYVAHPVWHGSVFDPRPGPAPPPAS